MQPLPHLPILRLGQEYTSLDQTVVKGYADGEPLARVSQANAGLVKRDLRQLPGAARALRALSSRELLDIAREAGQLFLEGTVPLNDEGATQTPEEYVRFLSLTSGMPHALCRANMRKIFTVFDEMGDILRGLMRGMDLDIVDDGFGEHDGVPVCYGPATNALGVVLPSNSPGVNSIWMPAIALRVPVVLKPGREEPWTPTRIVRSFIAAGCPREAFSIYPTDHEGAGAILDRSGRALLFGDESTTAAYSGRSDISLHGPGRSKVLIGEDEIDRWEDHFDVLVASVAANGGRSCINASTIVVPSHGAEIADALARRMAEVVPRAADDPDAGLSAFANPAMARWIDSTIDAGLAAGGAEDVTARHRAGDRAASLDGANFLHPTVVHCENIEHPLARSEFLFPYVAVVEVPHDEMVARMGPSLVVTAITRDASMIDALLASSDVDRLNVGPVPTSHVEWDQPHEGNLFEFLYARRAINRADGWASAAR